MIRKFGTASVLPVARDLLVVSALFVILGLPACQTNDPDAAQPTETVITATSTETITTLPTTTLPTTAPPPTDTPEPVTAFVPQLDSAPCPFDTSRIDTEVDCYTLTVPEDHHAPDNGRIIQLPAAIFRSDAPAADPILYLSGGPGEDALESVEINFTLAFEPFLAHHDLIMFEQRGTGSSSPSLDCPEVKAFNLEYLDDNLDLETASNLLVESYAACYERLANSGVNFNVYNSAQSAADVAMLRQALGYEAWNLYALSYGTRLAQTILRDNPAGVRSVVLDSVYPIEANLVTETPDNLKRAMDVFFAACANDEACNAAYPDLETVFWNLVADLNEEPRLLTISNLFTGEQFEARFNGEGLIGQLFGALYSPELTALFPQLIYNTAAGNTDLMARFGSISITQIDFVSLGMQISVQCYEEIRFTDPAEAAAAASEYEQFGEMFKGSGVTGQLGLTICGRWETGAVPVFENDPVASDIPTLFIHGEHDPITPPAWGRQVADRFSNAFFFEYPGQGHGPGLSSDCARSMILDFYLAPQVSPDDSCLAGMGYSFAVPLVADEIALIPFTDDTFGISGLLPEGWIEAGPGTYSDKGVNALVQQAAPGMTADGLVELLASQLGLESVPESVGEVEAENFTWTVYQFNLEIPGQGNFEFDLGVTESNGTAYLVLLQAAVNDYEALHNGVFLPVLEALSAP
jgi:pimeloyl-ACP methyl ester carboxylesterase